jgi:HSP20 family protein
MIVIIFFTLIYYIILIIRPISINVKSNFFFVVWFRNHTYHERRNKEMLLIRRDSDWQKPFFRSPFDELSRMQRDVDRLSEVFSRGFFREPGAGVFPLINLTENSDGYFIRAELPGMKADEIDISITNDSVSISGERKIVSEIEGAKYHRREREAGKFSRIFSLPGQVNTEKVEAKSVDGVLTVILPKAEILKPKQISVKAK